MYLSCILMATLSTLNLLKMIPLSSVQGLLQLFGSYLQCKWLKTLLFTLIQLPCLHWCNFQTFNIRYYCSCKKFRKKILLRYGQYTFPVWLIPFSHWSRCRWLRALWFTLVQLSNTHYTVLIVLQTWEIHCCKTEVWTIIHFLTLALVFSKVPKCDLSFFHYFHCPL